jgi:hypothetical protein
MDASLIDTERFYGCIISTYSRFAMWSPHYYGQWPKLLGFRPQCEGKVQIMKPTFRFIDGGVLSFLSISSPQWRWYIHNLSWKIFTETFGSGNCSAPPDWLPCLFWMRCWLSQAGRLTWSSFICTTCRFSGEKELISASRQTHILPEMINLSLARK